MKNEQTAVLNQTTLRDSRVAALIEVAAVAGLVMLAAHIKVPLPWTPVPITLQTLPVLAAAFVVGPWRATWGMLVYLAFGLAGAPMFAVALGPTAGYLLAFAAVPYIVRFSRSPAAGIAMATLFIYLVGTACLCIWLRVGPVQGLMMAVIPFIPGDAVKASFAYLIARRSTRTDNKV